MIAVHDVSAPARKRINFARINNAAVALLPSLLKRWLPDGRVEGNEYVARNPTRADRHLASFRINLCNDRWSDFRNRWRRSDAGAAIGKGSVVIRPPKKIPAGIVPDDQGPDDPHPPLAG